MRFTNEDLRRKAEELIGWLTKDFVREDGLLLDAFDSSTNSVISSEHIGFRWLPYTDALAQLTYENAKGILTKAHHTLSTR